MSKGKWLGVIAGVLVVLLAGGALAVGNYVYTSGTVVPCKINDDDLANSVLNRGVIIDSSGTHYDKCENGKLIQYSCTNKFK